VRSLLYNLLYQFSQFPVFIEYLKLRKQTMAELLTMDHHGTMHSVTNFQYCIKFFNCYLNANVSMPVFRFSVIIMCN